MSSFVQQNVFSKNETCSNPISGTHGGINMGSWRVSNVSTNKPDRIFNCRIRCAAFPLTPLPGGSRTSHSGSVSKSGAPLPAKRANFPARWHVRCPVLRTPEVYRGELFVELKKYLMLSKKQFATTFDGKKLAEHRVNQVVSCRLRPSTWKIVVVFV